MSSSCEEEGGRHATWAQATPHRCCMARLTLAPHSSPSNDSFKYRPRYTIQQSRSKPYKQKVSVFDQLLSSFSSTLIATKHHQIISFCTEIFLIFSRHSHGRSRHSQEVQGRHL